MFEFGDSHYERTLTPDEKAARAAAQRLELAPLREAALKARDAWFAWKEAA